MQPLQVRNTYMYIYELCVIAVKLVVLHLCNVSHFNATLLTPTQPHLIHVIGNIYMTAIAVVA